MCGIGGIVSYKGFPADEAALEKFGSVLKFRGPDQDASLTMQVNNAFLMLVHFRLSIIDLSEQGSQPMWSASGNTLIVFNGEIYNYRELRKELVQRGAVFKSTSDTEVILNLYEAYGISFLEKLDGMFAFMLFDKARNISYLVRDRFGKKPLYYSHSNGSLTFSSDIRSFNVFPGNLSLDMHALGYYFRELSTPIENSIWNEVKKVLPGACIEFSEAGIRQYQYWDASYTEKLADLQEPEILHTAEKLLFNAVRKRLMSSDVPVGTFLSSGIDSGLITAMAAQLYGKKLSTFSVGFDYQPYNELPLAKKVAERYNTDHHEIVLNPGDLRVVSSLIAEFGEPFADSSMIPSYYVAAFAAGKLKVALSGDGGDELFLGYPTYLQARRMEQYRKLNFIYPLFAGVSKVAPFDKLRYIKGILGMDTGVIAGALYRNMGFSRPEMARLFPGNEVMICAMDREHEKIIDDSRTHCGNLFDMLLYGSLKTRLVNDYLVKIDRSAMFASLEVRSPFLDRELFRFVSALGHEQLIPGGKLKYITKKIAEKHLPHENIHKPKQGFGIPIGNWFRKEYRKEFEEVVFDTGQRAVEMDYGFIRSLFSRHLAGEDHTDKLYALYVFHKWIKGQPAL